MPDGAHEELEDVGVVGDRLRAATLMVLRHQNTPPADAADAADAAEHPAAADALVEEQLRPEDADDRTIEALSSYLRMPIHISEPVAGVNTRAWKLVKVFGERFASRRSSIASQLGEGEWAQGGGAYADEEGGREGGREDDVDASYYVINLSAEEDGFRVLIPSEFSD